MTQKIPTQPSKKFTLLLVALFALFVLLPVLHEFQLTPPPPVPGG